MKMLLSDADPVSHIELASRVPVRRRLHPRPRVSREYRLALLPASELAHRGLRAELLCVSPSGMIVARGTHANSATSLTLAAMPVSWLKCVRKTTAAALEDTFISQTLTAIAAVRTEAEVVEEAVGDRGEGTMVSRTALTAASGATVLLRSKPKLEKTSHAPR